MSGFCDKIGLKSLIKYSTYHKNPENPSSIDLILTNNLRSFQNSCIIEKGLSDLHRMVLSIMKTSFERLKLVTNYRNYKSFESKCNYREKYIWFSRVYWDMLKIPNHHAFSQYLRKKTDESKKRIQSNEITVFHFPENQSEYTIVA